MERNFANENMEEFLRQNTEGLRMRPSAKVWKEISSQLNRRNRRIGIILGTSLLLTTALGYQLLFQGSSNNTGNSPVMKAPAGVAKTSSKVTPTIPEKNNHQVAYMNTGGSKRIFAARATRTQHFTFIQTLLEQNEEVGQLGFMSSVVDSYSEFEPSHVKTAGASSEIVLTDPMTIESVLNSFKPRTKKLSWQAYFTPTVSYRKLNDNTINNMIAHKPAFGFQLGLTGKYPVSRNAKLRAGIQFNVNRYEIKTNDSYTQLATIRLVDRNGVDYVRTITNYNNFSGYQTNWLQNLYLQLSAPVGVEVNLSGDSRVQFGVASTLQPTYVVGDKAYLISADYKNYTEMPDLVRRWNINTSLETFVGYSTGHLNWQVGPQVRYQILSSYLKKYPLKENLFDFGLKVGISIKK